MFTLQVVRSTVHDFMQGIRELIYITRFADEIAGSCLLRSSDESITIEGAEHYHLGIAIQ
jgi:hypothetical protein